MVDDEDEDAGGYEGEDEPGREAEDDEPPPERRRDGRFDYTNADGVVVPKDEVY
jgi:hypothetical protein